MKAAAALSVSYYDYSVSWIIDKVDYRDIVKGRFFGAALFYAIAG